MRRDCKAMQWDVLCCGVVWCGERICCGSIALPLHTRLWAASRVRIVHASVPLTEALTEVLIQCVCCTQAMRSDDQHL
jgi:hypothetical protein